MASLNRLSCSCERAAPRVYQSYPIKHRRTVSPVASRTAPVFAHLAGHFKASAGKITGVAKLTLRALLAW